MGNTYANGKFVSYLMELYYQKPIEMFLISTLLLIITILWTNFFIFSDNSNKVKKYLFEKLSAGKAKKIKRCIDTSFIVFSLILYPIIAAFIAAVLCIFITTVFNLIKTV